MGMADVDVYPRPRIRKNRHTGMWQVTWATYWNQIYTTEFAEWRNAIRWALAQQ